MMYVDLEGMAGNVSSNSNSDTPEFNRPTGRSNFLHASYASVLFVASEVLLEDVVGFVCVNCVTRDRAWLTCLS